MNLGIKLLVAEDDPNLGTILKAYLTQKGYTVFLAVDGQAALDSYQNDDVDACILDIMMPVKDGFTVLPYINADPVLAKHLHEVGCATVMPLGAPIGTNKGIKTRDNIAIIIEQAQVPVVVDAGLGAPSHAAEALEMGADAVLVNTAIAVAGNPEQMAVAFKEAVIAGRRAFEAGLGGVSDTAEASSPLTAFLD